MGLRGPAPKPTAIKKREGTYRRDRAAHREPKPRVAIPPVPKWLGREGRKEYRNAARLLVQLRVLTEADAMALAAYAHQYEKWREAEDAVAIEGTVLVSEKGGAYINPRQNVANVALRNMRSIMSEFGMTPSSRTRIQAQPEEEQSIASMLEHAMVGYDVVVGEDE